MYVTQLYLNNDTLIVSCPDGARSARFHCPGYGRVSVFSNITCSSGQWRSGDATKATIKYVTKIIDYLARFPEK